jgi:integrase
MAILPRYLIRRGTNFVFRIRVPRDLRKCVGKLAIKHSLRGYNATEAQLCALSLALRYARAFEQLRGRQGMATKPPSVEDLVAGLTSGRSPHFRIGQGSDGRPTFETDPGDTPESLAIGREMFKEAGAAFVESMKHQVPSAPKLQPIEARKAVEEYVLAIKAQNFKTKTEQKKTNPVRDFVQHWLDATGVPNALLQDTGSYAVSNWVESMVARGRARSTMDADLRFLGHFFRWAGTKEYWHKGNKPTEDQMLPNKSKDIEEAERERRPFTRSEIARIFDPSNFSRLKEQSRWAAIIGLYTGARVSEIGQVRLDDFGISYPDIGKREPLLPLDSDVEGGVYAMRITNMEEGQSTKNPTSKRKIFVHRDLVTLGLIERVKLLSAAGHQLLFPGTPTDTVNGMGNWASKAFSYYLEHTCKFPKNEETKNTIGMQSLRVTCIQKMLTVSIKPAFQRVYTGHEIGQLDVHDLIYSHYVPNLQKVEIEEKLSYGLDLAAIAPLMITTPTLTRTRRRAKESVKDAS